MAISVYTEKSETALAPFCGWVLFDGECEFCRRWARRTEPHLAPRGFLFLPLQLPWVRVHFGLPEEELLGEMRVLKRDGETFGGADAIVHLAGYIWWCLPLVALAQIPGARRLLRSVYRFIATRRACLSGACSINGSRRLESSPQQQGGSGQ